MIHQDSISSVQFIIYTPKKSGIPALFVSKAPLNSTVKFDCESISKQTPKQSIFLDNSSFYGVAFPYVSFLTPFNVSNLYMFFQLYRYEDRNDLAEIPGNACDGIEAFPLHHCFWKLAEFNNTKNPETGLLTTILRCVTTRPSNFIGKNGSLDFEVRHHILHLSSAMSL